MSNNKHACANFQHLYIIVYIVIDKAFHFIKLPTSEELQPVQEDG